MKIIIDVFILINYLHCTYVHLKLFLFSSQEKKLSTIAGTDTGCIMKNY